MLELEHEKVGGPPRGSDTNSHVGGLEIPWRPAASPSPGWQIDCTNFSDRGMVSHECSWMGGSSSHGYLGAARPRGGGGRFADRARRQKQKHWQNVWMRPGRMPKAQHVKRGHSWPKAMFLQLSCPPSFFVPLPLRLRTSQSSSAPLLNGLMSAVTAYTGSFAEADVPTWPTTMFAEAADSRLPPCGSHSLAASASVFSCRDPEPGSFDSQDDNLGRK